MIGLTSTLINNLTRIITFGHKTTRQVASFNHRIRNYGKRLDRYERQFHMRAPDLATKNILTFPIKIPFLLRHRYRPNRGGEFVDNSTRIHWNRLTPNEILLAFESI